MLQSQLLQHGAEPWVAAQQVISLNDREEEKHWCALFTGPLEPRERLVDLTERRRHIGERQWRDILPSGTLAKLVENPLRIVATAGHGERHGQNAEKEALATGQRGCPLRRLNRFAVAPQVAKNKSLSPEQGPSRVPVRSVMP